LSLTTARRIEFALVCLYGQGGIRTPETLARLPVFKTGAINRSATCPA
jgi:hypothetical protein